MATINYLLKSDKSPSRIYVRIRDGRKVDAMTPTPYFIDPEYWGNGKPKNTAGDETRKQLNNELDTLRGKILNAINFRDQTDIINSKWIKELIYPSYDVPRKPDDRPPDQLIKYFDYYIEHHINPRIESGEVAPSTKTKYKGVKKMVVGMQGENNRTLLIKDVNGDFQTLFTTYCKRQGYATNTIGRSIKFIKTVCRHARKKGVKTHLELNEIKGTTETTKSVYLNLDELTTIANKKMPHEHLDNARDWLIISCYTGQRVSDFLRFTNEMISNKGDKQKIRFKQVKTKKEIVLPLHPEVVKILKKRKGEFPRPISSQRYNEYIKEVCRIANLNEMTEGSIQDPKTHHKIDGKYPKWKLITSHIGRRSFATNFYGSKIPTPLLMHATGHTTEKMFLIYVGDEKGEHLADELGNYFDNF